MDQVGTAMISAEELARRTANMAGISIQAGAKLAGVIGAGKDEALVCVCVCVCVCLFVVCVCLCVTGKS
jgi:hypothetical protein